MNFLSKLSNIRFPSIKLPAMVAANKLSFGISALALMILPTAVYFAQVATRTQSQASMGRATLTVQLPSGPLPKVGQTGKLSIVLNPNGEKVAGVELYFDYSSFMEVTSVKPGAFFTNFKNEAGGDPVVLYDGRSTKNLYRYAVAFPFNNNKYASVVPNSVVEIEYKVKAAGSAGFNIIAGEYNDPHSIVSNNDGFNVLSSATYAPFSFEVDPSNTPATCTGVKPYNSMTPAFGTPISVDTGVAVTILANNAVEYKITPAGYKSQEAATGPFQSATLQFRAWPNNKFKAWVKGATGDWVTSTACEFSWTAYTQTPTPTPTLKPTATPTKKPTPTATKTPTPTPTKLPTPTPTIKLTSCSSWTSVNVNGCISTGWATVTNTSSAAKTVQCVSTNRNITLNLNHPGATSYVWAEVAPTVDCAQHYSSSPSSYITASIQSSQVTLPSTTNGQKKICVKFNNSTNACGGLVEYSQAINPGALGVTAWATTSQGAQQGTTKSGVAFAPNRSSQSFAHGAPNFEPYDTLNNTMFALGFGGNGVYSFAKVVENVSGHDLVIFEASRDDRSVEGEEIAEIQVSQDRSVWKTVGTASSRSNDGAIGAKKIDIASTGWTWIGYIKLIDKSNKNSFNYGIADGFDIDAIGAVKLGASNVPAPKQ